MNRCHCQVFPPLTPLLQPSFCVFVPCPLPSHPVQARLSEVSWLAGTLLCVLKESFFIECLGVALTEAGTRARRQGLQPRELCARVCGFESSAPGSAASRARRQGLQHRVPRCQGLQQRVPQRQGPLLRELGARV